MLVKLTTDRFVPSRNWDAIDADKFHDGNLSHYCVRMWTCTPEWSARPDREKSPRLQGLCP